MRDSLETIAAELVTCRACPRLVESRERAAAEKCSKFRNDEYWGRPVPGFGDPDAQLVIVGLAPGPHGANRTGRPFTGSAASNFLAGALCRAGVSTKPVSTARDDGFALTGVYLTNACKCAPPKHTPKRDELRRCASFLARELSALRNARVVLALGGKAWIAMMAYLASTGQGLRPRPKFAHGAATVGSRPIVVASYHPSNIDISNGTLTADALDGVLQGALALSRGAAATQQD